MSVMDQVVARVMGLPAAKTHAVVVERDVKIPMRDGTVLLGDHYAPSTGEKLPTVLVRSPYGRRGYWGWLYGRTYAERGYQVILQSVRGTFGSEGEFEPYQHEHDDGLDTIAWIEKQPWYSGEIVTSGASYLGYVQWALAADAGPALRAVSAMQTASDFSLKTYHGGSFSLEDVLNWTYTMEKQEERFGFISSIFGIPGGGPMRAYAKIPLEDADEELLGYHVPFFQTFLHGHPEDEWWSKVDRSGDMERVSAPVQLIAGWHDIFLPSQIRDYELLRAAGHNPYLDIGPWVHGQPAALGYALRQSLIWFDAHVKGETSRLREDPVRIFVMTGAKSGSWRTFASWPPSPARTERWHLAPEGHLYRTVPQADVPPSTYRYSPADPTPSIGGAALTRSQAGPKDQQALERRPDVLTFTSEALTEDVEVIGPVVAELYVRSNLPSTDFFCKLCDVNKGERSINICDGLVRLPSSAAHEGPDTVQRVRIELWPTAYRFMRGHRIRVQVSSGAHPRYARNLGDNEPLATADTLYYAHQAVYHDAEHPSAILLPVLG